MMRLRLSIGQAEAFCGEIGDHRRLIRGSGIKLMLGHGNFRRDLADIAQPVAEGSDGVELTALSIDLQILDSADADFRHEAVEAYRRHDDFPLLSQQISADPSPALGLVQAEQ